jgi:hypothetical protein
MSIPIADIKNCDECNCETNDLYLTKYGEILCSDCEADFIVKESENDTA